MPSSAKVLARERGRSPGWLSRMHRNNSPSQRSASPATTRESSPAVQARRYPPQVDGAISSKSSTPELDLKHEIRPIMPAFLKLTHDEIFEKFVELVRLEGERVAQKFKNPSLDGQWARLESDPTLDRYNNIHPWANNRVHLKVPEGCNDYINASPITLTSSSNAQGSGEASTKAQYICMQGPKRETVDHVWHMLWHELAAENKSSPAVIIMLSPTHDPHPTVPGAMFEKCFPYFPKDEDSEPLVINESYQLGEDFKASIRFDSKEPSPPGTELEIRKFIMTVDGKDEEKPIWHFLYPSWPDFGALEEEDLSSLMSLMSLSREKNTVSDNPRVIHCSAGVGRTGTFVALEFLIGELQRGAWLEWDKTTLNDSDPIFNTVNQLRMQRRTMVQSAEQYAFIYEVLRRMWSEKYDELQVKDEY